MHSDNIDNKNAFRDNNDNARREFSIFFFRLVHALDIFSRKISKSFNHCCWFLETFSNRWISPNFFPDISEALFNVFFKANQTYLLQTLALARKSRKNSSNEMTWKDLFMFLSLKTKIREKKRGKIQKFENDFNHLH